MPPALLWEPAPLTAERGRGEAWRTPAPRRGTARRPCIIHCQMGPPAACAGGSLCAWHFADCSSHVASSHLRGCVGCDPSPPPVLPRESLKFRGWCHLASRGLSRASSQQLRIRQPPSRPLTVERKSWPWAWVVQKGTPPPPHTHTGQVQDALDHSRAEKGWRPLCPKL